ncbi:MAG: alanyl-tRNA editing protein [Clostridiales bacterium]|nr:alanyl-tRNA editing protein [Clostridiales bacterium]
MIETRRLYYEDAYIKEFSATVLECRPQKKGFALLLDQSAFYPEGGGQPGDTGFLNETQVTDTHEKNGELLHFTLSPLSPGTPVSGKIDWARRFDLMQNHSGEHIVSGLAHKAFGCDNVGFHMGKDVITIDFSQVLTMDQLEEIEKEANTRIWENSPVEISYPTGEELAALPYRSKKELTGPVRIVTFPESDICACCGTHVAHTGEIGMVKILSAVKFREGVRVEMLAGKRVLNYLNMINEQNHQVSVRLSARPGQTGAAVDRLWEENLRLKGQIARLEEESFRQEARKCADKGNILLFKEEMDADSVRRLTDAIVHTCHGRCAVFSRNSDGSYKYAIGEKDGDLRSFTKEMNQALCGRGGGKPFFVQGSVKASETEIRKYFEMK